MDSILTLEWGLREYLLNMPSKFLMSESTLLSFTILVKALICTTSNAPSSSFGSGAEDMASKLPVKVTFSGSHSFAG
jgi:hypothetical protein